MAGRPHCAIVARDGRVAIRVASALATMLLLCVQPAPAAVPDREIDARVERLLARMTVAEKIGQLWQVNGAAGKIPDDLRANLQAGRIGSVLNEVDVATVNELQRIAVKESRLGIPLLIGRDVIHGFKTVLPIPLGQAATWNPDLVERGARVAALEAAASGVNWTFAPMVDVSRDPRWGRIAESFGEDPYVNGVFGAAVVKGFQGDDLSQPGAIAACAKHLAGYGASEGGRDYDSVSIPEIELRNVYLPPFKAAVDAGAATLMTAFSDVNGVPASGNRFLLTDVLRNEWRFRGFVVSDWESIRQLTVHGLAADENEAAFAAFTAGVDMEMVSTTYRDHLADLLARGRIRAEQLDAAVRNILRVKYRLGLFDRPYTDPAAYPPVKSASNLDVARQLATQSLVLLQNNAGVLPLSMKSLRSVAVVGPLADDGYEQLGTWIFDGDVTISRTPLRAIRDLAADGVTVRYARGMETTRSRSTAAFAEAVAAARASDAVVVFLGEESILSGEAHSRANIDLPGNQMELVRALRAAGKPLIAVILAGRPLTLGGIVDDVDAILFAWHPGDDGGAGDCRRPVRRGVAVGQAAGHVSAGRRAGADLLRASEYRQAANPGHCRAHRRHQGPGPPDFSWHDFPVPRCGLPASVSIRLWLVLRQLFLLRNSGQSTRRPHRRTVDDSCRRNQHRQGARRRGGPVVRPGSRRQRDAPGARTEGIPADTSRPG